MESPSESAERLQLQAVSRDSNPVGATSIMRSWRQGCWAMPAVPAPRSGCDGICVAGFAAESEMEFPNSGSLREYED